MMQVKLYNVEFIEYTNSLSRTVATEGDIGEREFLHAPKGTFIVKDTDLTKLQKFGKGIKKAEFVGYLYED